MTAVVQGLVDRLIATRRELHEHPELSGQEHRTRDLIAGRLDQLSLDGVVSGVAETGVVAWIRGPADGPVVLIRADIDALPMVEIDRGQPYRSCVEGVHHACGHDGHTAILIAVAETLAERRSSLRGSVVLVFQPAEERGGGARRVLDAASWPDDLTPTAAIGLHLTTALPVGVVDVRPGAVSAAAQTVLVTFTGPGGHAASPHLTPDPVVACAAFVLSAQTIVSRSLDPRTSAVLTFGVICGGTTRSAIPSRVELEGTIRTHDNEALELIHTRLRAIATGTAEAHRCGIEVNLVPDTYPAAVNDEWVASLVWEAASEVVGADKVSTDLISQGADDMGEFLLDFPGCYFFVGGANAERGLTADLHSPEFDFDEAALSVGVEVTLQAISLLHEKPSPSHNKERRTTP